MVWASGWKLASAVSEAGGLGILGAGSMSGEDLEYHIDKMFEKNISTFAINVPIFSKYAEKQIDLIIRKKVKIVFTSAGNPAIYTQRLKTHGITVVHVVSSAKFAVKAAQAGVDAIVAEGFEAGGHNGRDETTTLCLIPLIKKVIDIPLIAAGGICDGKSMMACMVLGADAVQIGSRFVATHEASSHLNFKKLIVDASEGATELRLKKLMPVRLLKNKFYEEVVSLENNSASVEELQHLLGKGRAKLGMFEGDLENGELEIGQVSAMINEIKSAAEIVQDIVQEYNELLKTLKNEKYL